MEPLWSLETCTFHVSSSVPLCLITLDHFSYTRRMVNGFIRHTKLQHDTGWRELAISQVFCCYSIVVYDDILNASSPEIRTAILCFNFWLSPPAVDKVRKLCIKKYVGDHENRKGYR
jgi:hypothetical protein